MASENESPMEEAQEELGEIMMVPEEISDVEDTEDGGAIVRFGEDESEPVGRVRFTRTLRSRCRKRTWTRWRRTSWG